MSAYTDAIATRTVRPAIVGGSPRVAASRSAQAPPQIARSGTAGGAARPRVPGPTPAPDLAPGEWVELWGR